jgi:hypothetical protein
LDKTSFLRFTGGRSLRPLRKAAPLLARRTGEVPAALAALALQSDVTRALSPQRAFVRAMILAATVVAGALLAAFELVSRR